VAHFEDLTPCTYFSSRESLVAIGWLEAGFDFPKGPIALQAVNRLTEFAKKPWQAFGTLG